MLGPETSDGRQADIRRPARAAAGPQVTHTCSGCDARWTGRVMAHCRACHETWGSTEGFVAHRAGPIGRRRCLTPAEMRADGYRPNDRGVWRIPRPADSIPTGSSKETR